MDEVSAWRSDVGEGQRLQVEANPIDVVEFRVRGAGEDGHGHEELVTCALEVGRPGLWDEEGPIHLGQVPAEVGNPSGREMREVAVGIFEDGSAEARDDLEVRQAYT